MAVTDEHKRDVLIERLRTRKEMVDLTPLGIMCVDEEPPACYVCARSRSQSSVSKTPDNYIAMVHWFRNGGNAVICDSCVTEWPRSLLEEVIRLHALVHTGTAITLRSFEWQVSIQSQRPRRLYRVMSVSPLRITGNQFRYRIGLAINTETTTVVQIDELVGGDIDALRNYLFWNPFLKEV